MQKMLSVLSRMVLIAGVLVALTPCSLCQRAEMDHATCTMGHMAKGNCCKHGQQQSPFCKIMGQNSVFVSTVHGVDVAVVPVVLKTGLLKQPLQVALASPVVALDTSPPRAPLSLRI